jgi:coproporphyrinogen III oxidase-like Fe-S oxidoreductase
MDDEITNEQRIILSLLVINHQLRSDYWNIAEKYKRCADETKALTAENLKRRKMVNQLFHDLGVWYQAFFDTADNRDLTLEEHQRILAKLQRFATPYLTWWRKQK